MVLYEFYVTSKMTGLPIEGAECGIWCWDPVSQSRFPFIEYTNNAGSAYFDTYDYPVGSWYVKKSGYTTVEVMEVPVSPNYVQLEPVSPPPPPPPPSDSTKWLIIGGATAIGLIVAYSILSKKH